MYTPTRLAYVAVSEMGANNLPILRASFTENQICIAEFRILHTNMDFL